MSLPPAIPPIVSNKNTGAQSEAGGKISTANGEYTIVTENVGRDLLSILKPGDTLSGRVVDQFANGSYLFTIRGRNVIAESQVPLLRDSVVQFEVVSTKTGLHIRLNGTAQSDSVSTSNMQSRLQALNIPITTQSMLVLQSFEQAEAPLDNKRIQLAIQALAHVPPAQQATLAASHALLANKQLPVTPAFINMAIRAVSQSSQQNVANVQNLQNVQQFLAQALPTAPQDMNRTLSQAQQNAANLHNTPTHTPQAALPESPVQSSSTTAIATSTTSTSTTAPQSPHISQVAQYVLADMPQLQLDNINDMKKMLQHNGIVPMNGSETTTAKTSVESTSPTDGAMPSNPDTYGLRTVMQELAQISQHLNAQQQAQAQAPQQHNAVMLESLNAIIQDMSAESIFKPQHLNDYDYILPLLSQHNGETQQARIAIANRAIPGQQASATFLRVDMELSQLGPLSLRMSSGHGPIIITIFGTGRVLQILSQAVPQLEEDLQGQNIEAHIRIANLLEHQESSYV